MKSKALIGILTITGAFAMNGRSQNTIIGNLSANAYLYGSELTMGYEFTPRTTIQITDVRSYSGDKVSIWTDTGTLLAYEPVSGTAGTWTETPLGTPLTLSANITYCVSAHYPASAYDYILTVSWPTTFANGTVGQNFYYSYGDVFPTTVYGTAEGPLVDLSYVVPEPNALTIFGLGWIGLNIARRRRR